MTPRDGDVSHLDEGDLNGHEDEFETTAVEETQDDWIQAEGYTPLSELVEDSVIFAASLPAVDDENNDATYEIYAGPNNISSSFVESLQSQHISGEVNDLNRQQQDHNSHQDFRVMADEALKTLEEDYDLTLQGRIIQSEEKMDTGVDNNTLTANHDSEQEEKKDIQSFEPYDNEVPVGEVQNVTLPRDSAKLQLNDAKIDAEAVQRAVAAIETKGAQFAQRFQQWQEKQSFFVESHSLIPTAPHSAFLKETRKAKQATANLSRPATIADCLCKLRILERLKQPKHLILHVIGVDHVETQSIEKIQSTFGPLVRWVAAATPSSLIPSSISILLIGPNIIRQSPVDLRPKAVNPNSLLKSATATCYMGTYHESGVLQTPDPHLVIAFNAGSEYYS